MVGRVDFGSRDAGEVLWACLDVDKRSLLSRQSMVLVFRDHHVAAILTTNSASIIYDESQVSAPCGARGSCGEAASCSELHPHAQGQTRC